MAIIDRTGATSLIPEDAANEILTTLEEKSAVMQLGREVQRMTRKERRMPAIASLVQAGFVNGDTGLKPTTSASWEDVFLYAEELAAIIPIPDSVLEDADYDIWAELQPDIVTAFGAAFDAAVISGTNAPTAWPDDLLTQITAASHTVDEDNAAFPDLYDAILGRGTGDEPGVFALVEEDGFMVNGSLAQLSMRSRLRALRDSNGVPIFSANMQDAQRYSLDGEPLYFPKNGAMSTTARLIAGDWDQLIWSVRTDMTYKLSDTAVIQNQSGGIEYNAFQQDMTAMRVMMRLAWALPNPLNRVNTNDATRLPFAALLA
jgi:HK97 family phage major capsid protein